MLDRRPSPRGAVARLHPWLTGLLVLALGLERLRLVTSSLFLAHGLPASLDALIRPAYERHPFNRAASWLSLPRLLGLDDAVARAAWFHPLLLLASVSWLAWVDSVHRRLAAGGARGLHSRAWSAGAQLVPLVSLVTAPLALSSLERAAATPAGRDGLGWRAAGPGWLGLVAGLFASAGLFDLWPLVRSVRPLAEWLGGGQRELGYARLGQAALYQAGLLALAALFAAGLVARVERALADRAASTDMPPSDALAGGAGLSTAAWAVPTVVLGWAFWVGLPVWARAGEEAAMILGGPAVAGLVGAGLGIAALRSSSGRPGEAWAGIWTGLVLTGLAVAVVAAPRTATLFGWR